MTHLAAVKRSLVLAALVLAVGACASGPATPVNDDPVVGDELLNYDNLYLGLEQLRPRWLRQAREVFIDGRYMGNLSSLRNVRQRVRAVELMPAREMLRRFGPCQAPGGTGTIDTPRDPECGTRPVIHVMIVTSGQ